MKQLVICIVVLFATTIASVSAQDYKDLLKERKEMAKLATKELNDKVDKITKKEAKKIVKEGWKTAPGALPLEKQLDRSFKMQYEIDQTGFPRYIRGEAQSVGGNYDAAKMQAINLAKIQLAGNIQTEVNALVDNAVGNNQLNQNEAVSTTKSVMGAVNTISQNIGRVIPVVELYRDTPSNGKEVRVMIFYNADLAKKAVQNAIREDLEKQGNNLVDKVNKILGL